jgi:hypothetical protein
MLVPGAIFPVPGLDRSQLWPKNWRVKRAPAAGAELLVNQYAIWRITFSLDNKQGNDSMVPIVDTFPQPAFQCSMTPGFLNTPETLRAGRLASAHGISYTCLTSSGEDRNPARTKLQIDCIETVNRPQSDCTVTAFGLQIDCKSTAIRIHPINNAELSVSTASAYKFSLPNAREHPTFLKKGSAVLSIHKIFNFLELVLQCSGHMQ